MPFFRKKPVTVEAVQVTQENPLPEGVEVLTVEAGTEQADYFPVGTRLRIITTLEGRMIVRDGDWIITGVSGERYPCKDHIFRATYEAVAE